MKRSSILFLAVLLCFGVHQGWTETDVAASVYGAFSSSTRGNGTEQSPSNTAGVLLELRHVSNPLVGYEFTYAYNRANQGYSASLPIPNVCRLGEICGPTEATATVPANGHEVTADWVASLKLANLRPFVLAGGGLLVTAPSAGSATTTITTCDPSGSPCSSTTTSTATSTHFTGVFVYGAGLDWELLPHIGVRFQYRGNIYKAPDLARSFISTDSFIHNSEPVIGAFFRF